MLLVWADRVLASWRAEPGSMSVCSMTCWGKTTLTAETAKFTSCISLYIHLSIYLPIHHSITEAQPQTKHWPGVTCSWNETFRIERRFSSMVTTLFLANFCIFVIVAKNTCRDCHPTSSLGLFLSRYCWESLCICLSLGLIFHLYLSADDVIIKQCAKWTRAGRGLDYGIKAH